MPPAIATHEAPAAVQRCHWTAVTIGTVPDHVPADAVNTAPSSAAPEIAGATTLTGATPTTSPVTTDAATAEPATFDAVTTTRNVEPTSATDRKSVV